MPGVASAFKTPSSLRAEHGELHAEIASAAKLRGRLGEAASAVAQALHAHFANEEAYALPPLAALPALAAGKIPPDAEEIRTVAKQLEAELPQMIREHRVIVAALKRFAETAHDEGRSDLVQLAIKVKLHAANEEAVLYPAAVLVGKYLNHVMQPKYGPAAEQAPTPQDSEC
jgi:hypothetical protein